MKKLLYSFLILSSATLFAQEKLAVADNTIGTESLFNAQKTMQVSKVHKSAATLPASLKKFSFAFPNGVTEYKFKNGFNVLDVMKLSEFNVQRNLPANNPDFVDDQEFTDTTAKIYPQIA
uniref:hypothetical protein n=1 Tax=Chryseobacterium sp. TaxID=1871047 RepID=UPI003219A033